MSEPISALLVFAAGLVCGVTTFIAGCFFYKDNIK